MHVFAVPAGGDKPHRKSVDTEDEVGVFAGVNGFFFVDIVPNRQSAVSIIHCSIVFDCYFRAVPGVDEFAIGFLWLEIGCPACRPEFIFQIIVVEEDLCLIIVTKAAVAGLGLLEYSHVDEGLDFLRSVAVEPVLVVV